jgi:hypothetical protein
MPVAVRAPLVAGVVHMEQLELLEADLRVDLVDQVPDALPCGDVVAGGVEMAGVDAEAEALRPAGSIDQLGRLVEVQAQQLRRAGRVLVDDRAALRAGERLLDQLHGPLAGVRPRVVLEGAWVHDDTDRPDAVAHPQRMGERFETLALHLLVLGRRIDQVDHVDRDGLDARGVHRLAEGGEVVVGVAGGAPHARALVEDLNRVAGALLRSLDRPEQATPCGNMGADQHDEEF